MSRTIRSFATLLMLLVLVAGCRTVGPGDDEAQSDPVHARFDRELQELDVQIREATGEARAETASQCRVIGVGAKPCGGPWRYHAYSTAHGDPARVEDLVARYNALETRKNERFGLASTCLMTAAPAVALEGGRCVLRAGE